jgi:shikimate dehydrogenase
VGKGDAAICGVIGYPVSHSLSPEIFAFLASRLKRPLVYRRLPVMPEELPTFVKIAQLSQLFHGWNVTIPHKTELATYCDRLSPAAEAMGAVNVIAFRDGVLQGHNTDVIGIRETLAERKFKAKGCSSVVYGAGGAAIAAGFALGEAGAARVVIQNRTEANARQVCARLSRIFRKTRFEATSNAQGDFDLYVNATPLGMEGFPPNALLPTRPKKGALAFDLIYKPARTSFLATAEDRGLKTLGGLDMLIWQAIGTWEIWFGPVKGKAGLKKALAKALAKALKK